MGVSGVTKNEKTLEIPGFLRLFYFHSLAL